MAYNGLIREYGDESLKICAQVFVTDLKEFPADWKIRYRCKDIDRDTTDIQDLCCSPENPLHIYKPVKNGFPVTVRTLDGKSFEVICSSSDTVKVLKLKIFQLNEAYPPEAQELHINIKHYNVHMKDLETLDKFQLTAAGSNVYLKIDAKALDDLQFGVNFKPINLQATYERSNGHFASPNWTKYAAGMNFCGKCPNPKCVSKEFGVEREVVARPLPFGEIHMHFRPGSQNRLIDCPACSKNGRLRKSEMLIDFEAEDENFQITPTSYLLCNARCLVLSRDVGEKGVWMECVRSKPKGQENEPCKTIDVGDKVAVLEMTTVEPWRSPYSCVRCDTGITFKAHEFEMPCGHVYHTWCHPSILKGLRCKVCQVKKLISGAIGDFLKDV